MKSDFIIEINVWGEDDEDTEDAEETTINDHVGNDIPFTRGETLMQ